MPRRAAPPMPNAGRICANRGMSMPIVAVVCVKNERKPRQPSLQQNRGAESGKANSPSAPREGRIYSDAARIPGRHGFRRRRPALMWRPARLLRTGSLWNGAAHLADCWLLGKALPAMCGVRQPRRLPKCVLALPEIVQMRDGVATGPECLIRASHPSLARCPTATRSTPWTGQRQRRARHIVAARRTWSGVANSR